MLFEQYCFTVSLIDVSDQINLDKHCLDSDWHGYCWLLPRSSTASSWVF